MLGEELYIAVSHTKKSIKEWTRYHDKDTVTAKFEAYCAISTARHHRRTLAIELMHIKDYQNESQRKPLKQS